MSFMEDVVAELRKARKKTSPILRGDVPVVEHKQSPIIDNIVGSVFIFVFSLFSIGSILLEFFGKIGFILGLCTSISLVLLFLHWPFYVIWKIKTKDRKKANKKNIREIW